MFTARYELDPYIKSGIMRGVKKSSVLLFCSSSDLSAS